MLERKAWGCLARCGHPVSAGWFGGPLRRQEGGGRLRNLQGAEFWSEPSPALLSSDSSEMMGSGFFSSLPPSRETGHHVCSFSLLDLGYLRDRTGTYTASFVVAGAFLLVGSGLLITLPHVFCFSASASKPQEPRTEAMDTKVSLTKEARQEA